MYEVEVKVPADHDAVRDRLAALGAESIGSVVQEDTYYDHPTRSFAETDEALRIRREQASETGERRTVLTYKGPRVDESSKTREEIEIAVGDADAAGHLLEALDFIPAAEVRKDRERFVVDGYTVTLDIVADLGEFVEVETTARADEIATLREGAFEILERVGVDPEAQIRASYLELLAEK